MMEFKLTIDITEKLADAINALSAFIVEVSRKAPTESAKIDPPESQESAPVIDEERMADCAGAQFRCPTPAQASPAVSTGDADAAPPAPVETEKPKKKKSAKKAAEAPAPVEAPQPESKPQHEPPAVEAPEKPEPAKAQDDPMCGMTVVDAVKAIVDEVQEKGIDMGQVNARVRAKANEIGLAYASAACLIKAIGYVEARRIALGE